jgi:O-antigen ligase
MELLIKEKLNFAGFVKKLEKAAGSEFAISVVGFAVLFFHVLGLDLAGFTVAALYLAFIFLSDAPVKAAFPPLVTVVCIVSTQNGVSNVYANLDATYYIKYLWYIVALAVITFAAAVYGIYKRKLKFRITYGFIGLCFMCGSMMLNGLFSENYNALNFLGGFVFTAYFMLFFVFCAFCVPEMSFDFIAKTAITLSLVVISELTARFLDLNAFSYGLDYPKAFVSLGWGISNSIAPMIAVGMPFTIYYAIHTKHSWFSYLLFLLQALMIILCLSRAMLLVAAIIGLGLVIYACIKSKGKQKIQIVSITCALLLGAGIALAVKWGSVSGTLSFYFENGILDRGRIRMWDDVVEIFRHNPFFGKGIAYKLGYIDIYIYLVHNTPLQFMLWSGVAGILGLAAHILFTALTAFRRPNGRRSMLLIAAMLIFIHSMLDVVWFFPATTLVYMLFVAAAENDCIAATGSGVVWERGGRREKPLRLKRKL